MRPGRADRSRTPAGGHGQVLARFTFGPLPGVEVRPAPAGAGCGAAALRALAAHGRPYLGGLLELRTTGRPSAAARRRAAALAVTSALRGGPGVARVRSAAP
ncbi:hypothetical protein ACIQUQ_31625 [Streptomyces sp. NPDC101118]|uniref:hypothetical protein n=1 Tax=Streptomyces sp. NPDC101118 TaxID=3366109 RepID=UPI0037FD829E